MLNNGGIQLEYVHTRSSAIGHVVRHKQYHNGIRVKDAETTIHITHDHTADHAVFNVSENLTIKDVEPSINRRQALGMAKQYLTSSNETSYENVELIIYPDDNGGRLAYEVSIIANSLLGEWHIMVDAKSGEIFEAIDKALYYCNYDHACSSHEHPESTNTLNPISVNGTGFVFDPDPLTCLLYTSDAADE